MYATIVCSNGTRDQYDWLEKQPFLRKITLTFWHSCNCVFIYLFIHLFTLTYTSCRIFSRFTEFQEVLCEWRSSECWFSISLILKHIYIIAFVLHNVQLYYSSVTSIIHSVVNPTVLVCMAIHNQWISSYKYIYFGRQHNLLYVTNSCILNGLTF